MSDAMSRTQSMRGNGAINWHEPLSASFNRAFFQGSRARDGREEVYMRWDHLPNMTHPPHSPRHSCPGGPGGSSYLP